MRADVPVEAALEIAGLHEVVDPGLEVLIEHLRIMRPVPKEMTDVQPAGVARAPDHRCRPGLLMERLIPDLLEMLRRCPSRADPRVRAIEKEKPAQPVRLLARKPLRGIGADVVRDD